MKRKIGSSIVSILIVLFTLGLDQWTKWAVVKSIDLHERITIIEHFFDLTYVQNTGAGFSLFAGAGTFFFAVLTIVALGFIIYLYITSEDERYQWTLAFIFSGALGNFIDRLRFGYVRDFFSFDIFGYYFPVFNIADICITCGFALIFIYMIYDEYKEKKKWKQENLESKKN